MTDTQQTFADFGVADPIVEALSDAGITSPFPIQAMTLPVALSGADIIGQAKTGTGKTLGFGIPLLQRVIAPGEPDAPQSQGRAPQALVVVPTRELAQQVAEDLIIASRKRTGLKIITIYGGKAFEPQIDALAAGVSFAAMQVQILPAVGLIGVTTCLFSAIGVKVGNLFGVRFKALAERAGGAVLVLMGLKILLEHLGVLPF